MQAEAPTADLTPAEVDRICHPLKQRAAKLRYLRGLGLTVRQTRAGDPLVNRRHYDDVMGSRPLAAGEAAAHGPAANEGQCGVVALAQWQRNRKASRGQKA